MSDESQPAPSLRLKPRLRADNASAPVPPPMAPATADQDGDSNSDLSLTSMPAAAPAAPAAAAAAPFAGSSNLGDAPVAEARPAGEGLTLRKRPSIALENSAAPAVPPPVPVTPPPALEAVPPGPISPEQAADLLPPPLPTPEGPAGGGNETTDVSRLKLKPRTSTGDAPLPLPSVGNAGLPPPITLTPVRTSPPIPQTAPPMPTNVAPALPPLSALPSRPSAPPPSVRPPNVPASSPGKSASSRPEHSRAFRGVLWGIGGLAIVGVAVSGFLAFRHFAEQEKNSQPQSKSAVAPAKTPATAETAGAQAKAPEATPDANVPADAQSMAGKMVQKAQSVVQANDSRVGEADSVVAEGATSDAKTASAVPANASGESSVNTSTEPQRAKTVVLDQEAVRPAASTAFKGFVVNMRVNGVFQGEPGRAFINGKMYHVGEVVESKLAITFTEINADRKILYFEDRTGAQMQRRY